MLKILLSRSGYITNDNLNIISESRIRFDQRNFAGTYRNSEVACVSEVMLNLLK